jgi:uncharacterized membrane protein
MIHEILLVIDTLCLGILFGGGVYESVVISPNYRSNLPQSIVHLREFMKSRTPANLFRVASPVTMLALLTTVILSWQSPSERWWFVTSLLALTIADTITYTFHYPRNKILFIDPLSSDTALLQKLADEWARGNFVRIILIAIALGSVVAALVSHG